MHVAAPEVPVDEVEAREVLQGPRGICDDAAFLREGERGRVLTASRLQLLLAVYDGLQGLAPDKLHDNVWLGRECWAIPVPIEARGLEEQTLGVEAARLQLREAGVVLQVPGEEVSELALEAWVAGVVKPLERPLALAVHGEGVPSIAARDLGVQLQDFDGDLPQASPAIRGPVDHGQPTLADARVVAPSPEPRRGLEGVG
mmetsp:Transcript_26655/g.82867  ORF Transcript_26655/g.82867 Transcript_26655/m.82867 type:complete len:201 (-) Transcript_26655:765-1367(-)